MFIESVMSDTKIIMADNDEVGILNDLFVFVSGKESTKIFILADPNVPVIDSFLQTVTKGFETVVYNEVEPNPGTEYVEKLSKFIDEAESDLIWVIGGGSAMDSAKAASVLLYGGGTFEEYLGNSPSKMVTGKKIPVICSPTTAGTGSEVTRFGVYTSVTGRKYSLASKYLQPDVALLIPEFTYSLPPSHTAATAFDALTHALETLWNKNATEITDRLALSAAKSILKAMDKAYESSLNGDTEGRKDMLLAATKGGISFNITGTAAIHALSFPLSEKWHIPHGTACAFFFEDVWELNVKNKSVEEKLRRLAEMMELKTVEWLFEYIVSLKKKMNLPSKFADLSIEFSKERDIDNFYATLEDPKMKNNIVAINKETIEKILEKK